MKREIAHKWINALRSGKYKQGRNVLRNQNDEFCCLGVLCDISGIYEWKKPDSNIDGEEFYLYNLNYGDLPFKVIEWAGIRGGPTAILPNFSLVSANDDKEWSFEAIACIIESRWDEI
jgi:hypothetical protein